jgi:hypothetical protein
VLKAPMVTVGVAAFSLMPVPFANAATSVDKPDHNNSASVDAGGDANLSQGNKCIIMVPQQAANQNEVEQYGLVPYLKKILLGPPKEEGASKQSGKPEEKNTQQMQNVYNIRCLVGNAFDNHPK